MSSPKELYTTLSADFEAEKKYSFANRGEGMMQCRENGTSRIYLVNKNTCEAWELLNANCRFSFWDASVVEIAAAFTLPYEPQRNAIDLHAPYYFGIENFHDGVAEVMWTLQPDGQYCADEDGFGMENDPEINFYAFIDTRCNILVPFQQMDKALAERYRKEALAISRNREDVPYVCLSPELTIPASENANLEAHKEKLLRIILGMMIQLSSQARNVYKHPEYKDLIGIFSALNPNPDNFLSISLLGYASKEEPGKYDIMVLTALHCKGRDPQGFYSKMGTFDTSEIDEIMSIEGNAQMILDDLIDSTGKILSGNIEKF